MRGKLRDTSVDSAARFLDLRRRRAHRKGLGRITICCPRYVWGDGTHDLNCSKYVKEIDNP